MSGRSRVACVFVPLMMALAVAGCSADSSPGSAGTEPSAVATPESSAEAQPGTESPEAPAQANYQATLTWGDQELSFGLPQCAHGNDAELLVSGSSSDGSTLFIDILDSKGEVSAYGKDLQALLEGTVDSFEATLEAEDQLAFTVSGPVTSGGGAGTFELTGVCAPTDFMSRVTG